MTTTDEADACRHVTVRLFAGLRDLFGWKEAQVPIGDPPDVAALLEALCATERQQRALLADGGGPAPGVLVLVNGHHCALAKGAATQLIEGDEVALFPPISGG